MPVADASPLLLPVTAADDPEARPRLPRVPVGLAILVFSALSLAVGRMSEGFLEADACTHYLYARFAFQEPHYLVNVWGRPLCTALYAVPAALAGRAGTHVASLAVAVAIGLVAMRLARLQNYRWPALALIFTLAQPMVFLHSFSELTELPFALLLACAFWAYRVERFGLMALLIGLSPLGRPEGFGFLGVAAVALVLHWKWHWLPLLALPLVAWNYAGWELYGREGEWWRWLANNWPYAPTSLYQSGHPLHFVALMPVIASPLVFPATLIGVWRSLRAAWWPPLRLLAVEHPRRCQALIAVLPLMILVGHSVLYAAGKMASNGEPRYMLVVAPFWGLLSAKGWEWVFQRLDWRRPHLWAGAAALLPILANSYWKVLPLAMSEDWRRAKQVAAWYRDSGIRKDHPYLSASHPGIYYFLDVSPTGPAAREWHVRTFHAPPPGTVLVWDPVYGRYNSDAMRTVQDDELANHGWEWRHDGPFARQDSFEVWLSPRKAGEPPPATAPMP